MVRPNWYMVEKKKVMLQTFVFNLLFLEGQLLITLRGVAISF